MKRATLMIAALLIVAVCFSQGTSTQTTEPPKVEKEKQYQISDTVRTELVLFHPNGTMNWVVGHEVQSGWAVQIPNPNFDPKKTGKDAQPKFLLRWAEAEQGQANPVVAAYLDAARKPLSKGVVAIPLARIINQR